MVNEVLMISIPVTLGVYLLIDITKAVMAKKKVSKVLQDSLTNGIVFVVVLAVVQMALVKVGAFPVEQTWTLWPF